MIRNVRSLCCRFDIDILNNYIDKLGKFAVSCNCQLGDAMRMHACMRSGMWQAEEDEEQVLVRCSQSLEIPNLCKTYLYVLDL